MIRQLTDLDVFVAVARQQGFAAGARAVGLSRSATSKRVAALEHRLGTRLFQRTTRQVALTPAGERFFARCAPLLDELQAAEHEVASAGTELVGIVRVASPLAYGLRAVGPSILAFCQAHPEVQVEVAYSDQFVDLVAEGFDLGVRGGVLTDSTFHAQRLMDIDVGLYASHDYLAHGLPTEPAALSEHRLVHYKRHSLDLERDGQATSLRVRPVLVTNNADARARAAEAGLGIAVLPSFALEGRALTRVLPQWRLSGRRAFWLLRPPGAAPRTAVQALADHLVQQLRV